MMISIRSSQDFGAGIFFTVFGAGAIILGWDYPVGEISQMGPGFFPFVLGLGTVLVGILLLIRGLSLDGPRIAPTAWLSHIFIIASIVMFGQLIETAGLVAAVIATVILTSLAYRQLRWHETVALATVLAIFAVVVFVYLLKQPLSVWGMWWTS